MKNKVLLIIIALLVILSSFTGILVYMSFQEPKIIYMSVNSTGDQNITNNSISTNKVSAKEYCDRCEIWVSNINKHNKEIHQFQCEICGKRVWEDGSHVDGSPYHTAKDYDDNDRKHGYNQYAAD